LPASIAMYRSRCAPIAALTLLAAWTSFDCWDAWAWVSRRVDSKAVAFSTVLALFWGSRLVFGMKTEYQVNKRR